MDTAPQDHPSLGALGDFPDRAATPASARVGAKTVAVVVVRRGEDLRAYLDLCPHQYLPLTWRGAGVLSADGDRLRCSVHGAEFDAADGRGLAGVPEGCRLTPAPIRVTAEGTVLLLGAPVPL